MFSKKFKVKGEDVNDFMVMQDEAYHQYTSILLKSFLLEKGYDKHKKSFLTTTVKESIESLTFRKKLLFTQQFFVNLAPVITDNEKNTLYVKSNFFDINNTLCAITIAKLNWLDETSKQIITPPKKILNRLFEN